MAYSNFPGGFSSGLTVRNVPVVNTHSGNVYWVSSTQGSDGNKGTFDRPFATLNYAIGRCTANNGDIIYIKENHTETVTSASGILANVAGITIIGLGRATSIPSFTFSSVIGASFDVTANNVCISNIRLIVGIDNLTTTMNITGSGFWGYGLRVITTNASFHVDYGLTISGSSDSRIVDFIYDGQGGNTGGIGGIAFTSCTNLIVNPFWCVGNWSNSFLRSVTTSSTNLMFYGNQNTPKFVHNQNSSDLILSVASSTGFVSDLNVRLADNAANITEAFTGTSMVYFQPINIVNAAGESSMQTNITASTDA